MMRRWFSALILFVLFAACQPTVPVVVVPTLAVLPSPTATDIPTRTLLPTWTFTYTPTDTPTLTPSLTFTPSNTPTATLTPSDTYTPTPTITPSLTPSLTPTHTPTSTLTPSLTPTFTPTFTETFTPTPSYTATLPAQIISFGANMTSVTPGASVQFAWSAQADTVRMEQYDQNNVLRQTIPALPTTGTITVVVPSNQGQALQYRLVASRLGVDTVQALTITVVCTTVWFFGDQYAPPGTGCPAAGGAVADGAFQRFERGAMIYVAANGLNRVYGLQNDSARYVAIANGWDGSTLRADPAPAGLTMPERMFNWVYYNTLAPVGSWNSALGWAVSYADSGARAIQWEGTVGGTSPFFIDAPAGEVYRFSGGDTGTWQRVK